MTELVSTGGTAVAGRSTRWGVGRLVRSAAVVCALAVVATLAGVGLTATAASAATPTCTVDVVAHPDDDLFFLNPALAADIKATRCVSTVYVTSGDAGRGTAYSRSREKGIQAAYAKMAGVANVWVPYTLPVAGKSVTRSTLLLAPGISVTFLRLPDGNPDGSGTTTSNYASLEQLYLGKISSLRTVDTPAQSYTKTALVQTLGGLMTLGGASTVRTLDNMGDYGDGDHSDHYTVARLATQAQATYAKSAKLVSYAGYRAQELAANLSTADTTAKQNAFLSYAPFDPESCQSVANCDYGAEGSWLRRQYLAADVARLKSITTGSNIARTATVTASSANLEAGQTAAKAIDGVIDGYPGDYTAEWATAGGTTGSWLQLDWPEPVQIDAVVLYDRPNGGDWVTGSTLSFSDGSSVAVGALNNTGGGTTVTFAARTTTSLRFTVTAVGPTTGNVGLAELQAWTSGSTPVTTAPVTTAPVTTAPVTTAPVTTAPVTTAPVTTAPVTTAPVTTAPVTTAPVTTAPVTTAPVTTAPVTTAPVATGPVGPDLAPTAVLTGGLGAQPNGVGTWVQLTWAKSVTVGRVVLVGPAGASTGVTGATLTFADGSTVTTPVTADATGAAVVTFPARSTAWVKVTVTGVSGALRNYTATALQVYAG